jgi:alcohol dehydrogenase YqhD (iron-dependent ADH family)
MQPFELHMATRLVVGEGVFSKLGREAARLGRRALVVVGQGSARRLGLVDRSTAMLEKAGVDSVVFDGIEPNPRHSTCDAAAEILRTAGLEQIIAIGGGSVMDAAKAIGAAAVSGRSCWDHCFHAAGNAPVQGCPPIITVPMTAATGSEANGAAVISNWETREKCAVIHSMLIPRVAICDPALHVSVPADTTADGCVDILSHGFESYFNGDSDCGVQDRITEALFNIVFEWGPVAVRDGANLRARRELMYASTLMLNGLANSGRGGAWPNHDIEHALSGHYDIAHGRGLAIILPRYLRHVADAIPHRLAQFGRRCLGVPEADERNMAEQALGRFVDWLAGIGRDLTLGDVGIGPEKFGIMADDILRNNARGPVYENIVPLDRQAFIDLFHACARPNRGN